jgi:hypothetical protein
MTTPGGNAINLAALWVPVMPETSHLASEMKNVGKEMRRNLEEGLNSGTSPDQMGQSLGQRLGTSAVNAFGASLKNLPGFASGAVEGFSKVNDDLAEKLRGKATDALKTYRSALDEVAAASSRSTEADTKLNLAKDNGINKASIMLPLMQEQTAAHNALAAATSKSAAAHDDYTSKLNASTEASHAHFNSSAALAGMLGGAVTGGIMLVVSGLEKMTELGFEAFKGAIEGSIELGKKLVEVGEAYEHLNIQIQEVSPATGQVLDQLEATSSRVFASLDVAGKDTGQTVATLANLLNMAANDPALEILSKHVEELQGRFGKIDVQKLAAQFSLFGVAGKDADNVLASLLQSARGASMMLPAFLSNFADVGAVMQQAGLNAQQTGAFIEEIAKKIPNLAQGLRGFSMAEKVFGDPKQPGGPIEFNKGLELAGQHIKELIAAGDTAGAQSFSEHLFGARQWQQALIMIKAYFDVVRQGPDAFNATGQSIDDLLEKTRTLTTNVWEELKHKVMDMLKPVGIGVLKDVTDALTGIGKWFDDNHDAIIAKIKAWGSAFIDDLPQILQFTGTLISLMGDLANTLKGPASSIMDMAAAFLLLTGHFQDSKDMLNAADKLLSTDFSKVFDPIAKTVKDIHLDTTGIKDDLFGAGAAQLPQNPYSTPGSPRMPLGRGGEGQSPNPQPGVGQQPYTPSMLPPGSGGGGTGIVGASISGMGDNRALAQSIFPWPASEWPAFDQLEMKEAGYNPLARNASGAFGIGQFLGHENDAYASGYSQNPQTQLETMFRYIADRYGTPSAAWAQYYKHPGGQGSYAQGSFVSGGAGGIDDVPALLTAGEYVWDKDTVDKYGWLISMLHNAKHFQGGGGTGSADYAASGAGNDDVGIDPQLKFAEQIASGFGLTLTAGKSGHGTHQIDGGYHDSGQAADFSNGMQTDAELAFAMYMIEHFGSQLAELIHSDPRLPKLIKDGQLVDPLFYGQDTLDGHKDHVHLAIKSTQALTDQLSPGTEPLTAGLPGSMSKGGFPGMPGQYGGGGAYGGQTADQAYSTATAVQSAKDRLSDTDWNIQQKQAEIDKAKKDLAGTTVKDWLGHDVNVPPDATQTAQINDNLSKLNHELEVLNRTRGEQGGALTEAERKQQESALAPPGKGAGQAKVTGEAAFQQLGGGLLKGIASDLGFGDVFSKSPMDWGIVKLATGLASWGIGTANAWADEIGRGHTGMTGNQPIPGWDAGGGGGGGGGGIVSGLLGGIGLPGVKSMPNVSAGSNIRPGTGQIGVQGTGPAPGPMVQGDYMPINITQTQPDTKQIMAPVQNYLQSSQFTNSGGFPPP